MRKYKFLTKYIMGNKQTPIRNSKVPTRKTTTMITVKASKPPIVNGCGVGGSGGGLGHELSQSAHEQAGVLSCIDVCGLYVAAFIIDFYVFKNDNKNCEQKQEKTIYLKSTDTE
ncbi:hypothetical protein GQX74_009358 [Glossina fuscipes]|nr:hypothetical protein GQX74_009358 [Glossina fuscipes]